MVPSIPFLLLLLLILLFTIPIHNSSLEVEDETSNDPPTGFFLPFESNLYIVLTIGTPTRTFNLKLDSSTHLTFLECDSCDDDHQCSPFDRTSGYDGKSSNTFSAISCHNSSFCPRDDLSTNTNSTNLHNTTTTTASLSLLCTPTDFCRYEISSFSAGYLVSDTLQLTSSITDQENSLSVVHGFVFGCGTSSNRAPQPEDDEGGVDGRVSLTSHRFSLLSQLRVTRFSHCLWPSSAGSRNYIRLGSVADYGGDMMMVPMLNTTEMQSFSYHLALFGISIEHQRLRSNETSSTMAIDIGTYYTRLEPSLYEKVKEELMTQIEPTVAYEMNELMCFTTEARLEIESLPKLTLHLQGFNYTIANKGLYVRDSPSSLCAALVRSSIEDEDKTVLGSSGLIDYAVGYDISLRMLAFQQRDCLADFVDGM